MWKNCARIPVMAGPRCIEMAGPERVRHLCQSVNVKTIRRHRDRMIVEIQVLDYADDSRLPSKDGNPLKLSSKWENAENPPNVWHHKRLLVIEGVS